MYYLQNLQFPLFFCIKGYQKSHFVVDYPCPIKPPTKEDSFENHNYKIYSLDLSSTDF